MRACARSCAHRELVHDYRVARYAAEQAREEITLGYETETRRALEDLGPVSPTFRQWLEGHRQEEPEP